MTVMQFDSHRGWYNPGTDRAPLRFTGYAEGGVSRAKPRQLVDLSDHELQSIRSGYAAGGFDAVPLNRRAAHDELTRRGRA